MLEILLFHHQSLIFIYQTLKKKTTPNKLYLQEINIYTYICYIFTTSIWKKNIFKYYMSIFTCGWWIQDLSSKNFYHVFFLGGKHHNTITSFHNQRTKTKWIPRMSWDEESSKNNIKKSMHLIKNYKIKGLVYRITIENVHCNKTIWLYNEIKIVNNKLVKSNIN